MLYRLFIMMLFFVSCNKQAEVISTIPIFLVEDCVIDYKQLTIDSLQLENDKLNQYVKELKWVLKEEKKKSFKVSTDIAFLITEEILLLDNERAMADTEKDKYTFCIQILSLIQKELNNK